MQPRRSDSDAALESECPGRDRITRFVEGALSADEEDSLRSHTDGCASCRRLVANIGAGTGSVPFAEAPPQTREAERDAVIGAGALIGGKYRVRGLLGAGGMGKVFAAEHVDLGHTLAVKVMHPELALDADSVKRFLREGRAAALLKSDHAARINDVGRLPSGVPFLVMEYLEGEDLDRHRKRTVVGVEQVVDYMLQALAAIAEAHAAGLVHRDIKPQNLFLAKLPDGKLRVKVLDFGLAKELPTLERSNSALTTDNMILGSPHFMSPEQIRSPMTVDGRTDIWAVGATMFMLLTGRAPFTSNTVHGLLARILADPPPSARELRGDVPPALDAVLMRCMAKDVHARYQTVTELATALRSLGGAPSTTDGSFSSARFAVEPPTIVEPPPTVVEGDALGATRVRPMSSASFSSAAPVSTRPAHGAAHSPPTMLAAGAVPQTQLVPTQHAGVPPTMPMGGTLPLGAPLASSVLPAGALAAAAAAASAPRAHLKTLASEPAYQLPSLAPEDPQLPFDPTVSFDTVTRPKATSARRAATIAFALVSIAALVVVALGVRAALAHDVRPAPQPSASAAASEPARVTAPAVSAVPSIEPTTELAPTAQTPPPAPSTSPSTTAPKKNPRPVPVVPAPVASTKDPYGWGK